MLCNTDSKYIALLEHRSAVETDNIESLESFLRQQTNNECAYK